MSAEPGAEGLDRERRSWWRAASSLACQRAKPAPASRRPPSRCFVLPALPALRGFRVLRVLAVLRIFPREKVDLLGQVSRLCNRDWSDWTPCYFINVIGTAV